MTIRATNHKCYFVLSFFVLTVGSVQLAYSQANPDAIIDSYISRQAEKQDCVEYQEARKILRGDINGDGKADVVVIYTLEGCGGGINWARILAVFLRKGQNVQFGAETAAGAKGVRAVDLESISGGKINLETMGYRANDPACCPSRKGKTKYAFSKGKLREIK